LSASLHASAGIKRLSSAYCGARKSPSGESSGSDSLQEGRSPLAFQSLRLVGTGGRQSTPRIDSNGSLILILVCSRHRFARSSFWSKTHAAAGEGPLLHAAEGFRKSGKRQDGMSPVRKAFSPSRSAMKRHQERLPGLICEHKGPFLPFFGPKEACSCPQGRSSAPLTLLCAFLQVCEP
jgi:hypothetical protein